MEYEHIDFPAAVRKLAARAGIQLLEEKYRAADDRQQAARRTLLKLHAEAAEWFHENLLRREIGAPGRSYLKSRGLTPDVARSWKLGYAPESWDAFSKWALGEGYSPPELVTSGLVSRREAETDQKSELRNPKAVYDRFRGRLMFPIRNDIGEVIAFSGRLLAAEPTAAKYVNSPETALFRKGRVLFGLDRTKRALIDAGSAIICEGQLDLITVFEAGIGNVVAPQGTAFTDAQARLLKRFVGKVVLCFDADAAGQKATEHSLAALLAHDLSVRVAEMPPGDDPDSLVRKAGRAAFEQRIASAADFFDFWIAKKATPAALSSLQGKMDVARELATTAAHVRTPIMRGEVINKIAARLGIRATEFAQLVKQNGEKREAEEGVPQPDRAPAHELAMLCLLALRDEGARRFLLEQDWSELLAKFPGSELLGKILQANLRPADPASLAAFQSKLTPAEESLVSSWTLQKMPADPPMLVRQWWRGMHEGVLRRELELAEDRLRLPGITSGQIMQLQKEILDLRQQLHELPRFLPAQAHESPERDSFGRRPGENL